MDWLFKFGIFLLPFENFFFAPSIGWAALSPIVFALYALRNYRYILSILNKYNKILIVTILGLIITIFNLMFIEASWAEALQRVINTIIVLGLGFCDLFSFEIYFIKRKGKIDEIVDILLTVYKISMIIGIIQWLTIMLNISFVRELDAIISKRSYLPNRVQFTFTEPSFISMHLYGVLLPIYLKCKDVRLRNLIIVYAVLSLIFKSGMRIIIDGGVVLLILAIYQNDLKKVRPGRIILSITAVSVALCGIVYIYNNNSRFQRIIDEGVYADGSFSSRFFRINASIKGYKNDILHALVGYGYGQEIFPLQKGYEEARQEYQSKFLIEVDDLKNLDKEAEESATFCLYTRIISECGLIIAAFLAITVITAYCKEHDRNWKAMLLISMYLYIQFESYAFYTIWIVIVLSQLNCDKYRLQETSARYQ